MRLNCRANDGRVGVEIPFQFLLMVPYIRSILMRFLGVDV